MPTALLTIKGALPHVFEKTYPVVDPDTEMLPAMSLLRFHEIDAVPLSFEGKAREGRHRAVIGFSSLAKLLLLGPQGMASFLKQPCEKASEPLATVRATQRFSVLLDTFSKTRFGFARVEDGKKVGALAGLLDVLGVFETEMVSTDLVVGDVGTRRLSMPGSTSLKTALEVMFEKRYRRLFVSEGPYGKEFFSDRGIIGYIFSPAILKEILDGGKKDVLDAPISKIQRMTAKEVAPGTPIKDAARLLREEKAGQCLVCEGMVATPWDIVMKPWETKALEIS